MNPKSWHACQIIPTPWPPPPADGPYFKLLAQAIQEHYSAGGKPIPVVPFLLSGGWTPGALPALAAPSTHHPPPTASPTHRHSRAGGQLRVRCTAGVRAGMTDSRNLQHLSRHGVLRFCPLRIARQVGDVKRIHGTNERFAVQQLPAALCLYRRAVQLLGGVGGQEQQRGGSAAAPAAAPSMPDEL